MRNFFRIAVGGAALTALACGGDARKNLQPDSRTTSQMQNDEEAALIEQIVARVPEQSRASLRDALADRAAFHTSSDSILGPMLEQLMFLRRPRNLGAPTSSGRGRIDRSTLVKVQVALVPSLGAADTRAIVVRRPQENGIPLLLVRSEDATSGDLLVGLVAAAKSMQQHPAEPAHESRKAIHAHNGHGVPSVAHVGVNGANPLDTHLAMLNQALFVTIPGVGHVRSITIMVPKNPDASKPTS